MGAFETGFARAALVQALVLIALVAGTLAATAHSYNESYVYFDVTEDTLSGRVEVTLSDLGRIAEAYDLAETPLSNDDVRENPQMFFDYFSERLQLRDGTRDLEFTFDDVSFLKTRVDTFAQLHFDVENLEVTPLTLEMAYDGLSADIDPTHRGFALIGSNTRNGMEENESYISLIFSPGDGVKTLYLNDEPRLDIALTFVEHGVWHIWLGFDHVLFLVTLLLSSVMYLNGSRWDPATSLSQSLRKTVLIVTVFTVAHTITLSLATFDIVRLPVVFVEAVIAISIAVVALGNLLPRFHMHSWKVVFVFGLFHGFGFANVLEPLGLDPTRKAIGLFAFNVGVELGQLVIVLLLFPLFFLVREKPAYRIVGLQLGSVGLILLALYWFGERIAGAMAVAGGVLPGMVG